MVVPQRATHTVVVIICRRGALSIWFATCLYIRRISRAPAGWSIGGHVVSGLSVASNCAYMHAWVVSMYPLQGGHATTRGNAVPGTHFTYLLAGCIGVLSRGAVNGGGACRPLPSGREMQPGRMPYDGSTMCQHVACVLQLGIGASMAVEE